MAEDKYIKDAEDALLLEMGRRSEFYQDVLRHDLKIVWAAKVLQNWKVIFAVPRLTGFLAEVTGNGDDNLAYVDIYRKHSHSQIELPSVKLVDKITLKE